MGHTISTAATQLCTAEQKQPKTRCKWWSWLQAAQSALSYTNSHLRFVPTIPSSPESLLFSLLYAHRSSLLLKPNCDLVPLLRDLRQCFFFYILSVLKITAHLIFSLCHPVTIWAILLSYHHHTPWRATSPDFKLCKDPRLAHDPTHRSISTLSANHVSWHFYPRCYAQVHFHYCFTQTFKLLPKSHSFITISPFYAFFI